MYYLNPGYNVNIDNIDFPDTKNLRAYWTIEYGIEQGGYLIRSLHDPTQALELEANNTANLTSIWAYRVHNNKNQYWNIMPR